VTESRAAYSDATSSPRDRHGRHILRATVRCARSPSDDAAVGRRAVSILQHERKPIMCSSVAPMRLARRPAATGGATRHPPSPSKREPQVPVNRASSRGHEVVRTLRRRRRNKGAFRGRPGQASSSALDHCEATPTRSSTPRRVSGEAEACSWAGHQGNTPAGIDRRAMQRPASQKIENTRRRSAAIRLAIALALAQRLMRSTPRLAASPRDSRRGENACW